MNKRDNPWVSILCNLILPVFILNYGYRWFPQLGPVVFMLIALSIPITYGGIDYFRYRKHNMLSILGGVNIFLTGGFALFTLEGIWFAVKEATFPLIIGIGVLFTAFTKNPVMKWFISQSALFRIDNIQAQLETEEKKKIYHTLLKKATLYLSFCFFFSAILNFYLAVAIFKNDSVTGSQKQQVLNEQIADMTWVSFFVIGLPLTLVLGVVFWWLLYHLKKLTSLTLEQMLQVDKPQSSS